MNMKKPLAFIGCVIIVIAAYFFGYFSVRQSPLVEPAQTENTPSRAATGSAKLYGKFVKISESGVELRLVEWVEGSDNQEQAALETGRCTLDRIEKDECLPNPFFMRETQKTMTLPINQKLTVQVLSPGSNGEIKQDEQQNTIHREISLTELGKMLANVEFTKQTPFIFTTTSGVIAEIREQYIP
ncbi:MAG: hypothetical protein QY323_05235 [Patescibacteria group bacterium]|nr:MAG: hypothetical protein QY323_05235 [Patescibacteria group bacterium]